MTQTFQTWLEGQDVRARSLNEFTVAVRILGYEVVERDGRMGVKRPEMPCVYEPWNPIHPVRR
jgi:hypothetical protein